MNTLPVFSSAQLEALARVLGHTSNGLTGTEIGQLLAASKIPDVTPEATKWVRLYNAFVEFQNARQFGNHVVMFINRAMEPARYVSDRASFTLRQTELNAVLAFCGYRVADDGKVMHSEKAKTLDEARSLAGRMKAELERRNAHAEVLRFCAAEIVAENCFHAVLEAMKSVTSRLRSLSGLTSDGAELVQACFSVKSPLLKINALSTETDLGEQRGFMNLLTGLYGTFRNPTAHEPKIEWEMTEQDALDVLTTVSLIHRKLDRVRK